LFGIRTANNGFSSQSEEMKTAFSIMQTMTIMPFQNVLLNAIDYALTCGGYADTELYFEQLTPLVILSTTAEETDKTVEQVEDEVNDSMENPATVEDEPVDTNEDVAITEMSNDDIDFIRTVGTKSAFFTKEFN
jgi:hypothetical protein